MKKFWKKVLGLATLATVVPVSITRDEDSGKTTYQSLLATLTVKSGQAAGEPSDVSVNIGEGVLTEAVRSIIIARQEAAMYTDEELISSSSEAPVETETVEAIQAE